MKFPDDEIGSILQQMDEHGEDLSQPVENSFFILFEKRSDLLSFLESRNELECSETISWVDEASMWELAIVQSMIPDYDIIKNISDEIESSASLFNGVSDGWTCITN
ncbi:MAG: ribonuclease E inhibitor RraB [Fibrobacterales bacterium]